MDRGIKIKGLWIVFIFHLILFIPFTGYAEEEYVVFKLVFEQEEIGSVENIYRPEGIYVSIPELMDCLGYSYQYQPESGTFAMCCPDRSNCFRIHGDTLWRETEKYIVMDSLLLVSAGNIYLRSDYFGILCGIRLKVIFQSFKIIVTGNKIFPFEALRNQELRRQALKGNQQKGRNPIDTIPLRKFSLNSMEYSVSGNFSQYGIDGYDLTTGINSELLRGSLNLNYNLSTYQQIRRQEFNFRQMYELPKPQLRQLSVFRQGSSLLQTDLGGYVNGVYLSNDDATFFNRRYYLYKARTRPETNVEIYSNGELVSFITTDSLGNFEATVPVVDGVNTLSAVIVNGFGDATVDEQSVYISQDLLPKKQFRYQFSSGLSDDKSLFSGITGEYGVTSCLTLSSRAEWVRKERGNTSVLAGLGAKFSYRSWLQLGMEYYPFVKHKFNLTGNTKGHLGYSFVYDQYRKEQRLMPMAPLRDIRASISYEVPFIKTQHGLTLSFRELRYRTGNVFSSFLRLNVFKGVFLFSGDLSISSRNRLSFGDFSGGGKIGYRINPDFYNEFHYNYNSNLREHILRERFQFKLSPDLRGNFSVNFYSGRKQVDVEFGISYRIPQITLKSGARTSFPAWNTNAGIEGAVQIFPKNMNWSNRKSSGASLHVVVFIDANANKAYDKGETIISEANVLVKTGAEVVRKPSGIYFLNITPGHAFKVNIPRQPLRDISWQITPVEKTLYLAPGQSHSLYIPVQVVSEVTGEVFRIEEGKRRPLKRVIVELVRQGDDYTVRESTDEWGVFYFTGLIGGDYVIKPIVDEFLPNQKQFTIPAGEEGVQLDGVDFDLSGVNRTGK